MKVWSSTHLSSILHESHFKIKK